MPAIRRSLRVVCAFDEGPGIGLGHRRRCEAIAGVLDRIVGMEAVVAPVRDAPFAADVLVVDSYKRRADDPDLVAHPVVVAIDDLDRDLAVDCVVAPGLATDGAQYRRAARVLAGPRYAVVAPEVIAMEPVALAPHARTVLVTMGAADAAGIGARIAERLVADGLRVRLVVGPWGARAVPPGVDAVEAPAGLAVELAAADLVVTAGGVTLLEALALGRPCVAVATAANQQANVTGAVTAGAARAANAEEVPAVIRQLADDLESRHELTTAARALIDGRGATRIAECIHELARTTSMRVVA